MAKTVKNVVLIFQPCFGPHMSSSFNNFSILFRSILIGAGCKSLITFPISLKQSIFLIPLAEQFCQRFFIISSHLESLIQASSNLNSQTFVFLVVFKEGSKSTLIISWSLPNLVKCLNLIVGNLLTNSEEAKTLSKRY
ncbi:unnamed protein product [Vicia faba]|uniref:Uncharacterized protein n=1 Tax=Vicia faba TaxID=3906 RepID=A0AAV1BB81_VICFA|nr:unnamed protein product [Vicia faba]